MIKISNLQIQHHKKQKNSLFIDNLEITSGSFVALIGPSGAGKTTFLKAFLKANFLQSGQLLFNHFNINQAKQKTLKKHRQKVNYLSAKPLLIEHDSLYLNLKRNIKTSQNWFLNFFNVLDRSQFQKLLKVLELLEIKKLLYKTVDKLSSGQKQRVNIAITLLKKSPLLLADEPVANLDRSLATKALQLFKTMIQEDNGIAIISLHNLEFLKTTNIFTDVLIIKEGKMINYVSIKNFHLKSLKSIYEN